MGLSANKKDVLKLVHPGKHVEIHRQPITAAEIMNKYPRHCIARPDVFKFPWIVVSPESVLVPGKVFYIVPDRAIYNLLKAKRHQNQPFSIQNQSPDDNKHHYYYNHGHSSYYTKRKASLNSSAGTTPKHQGHEQYHRRQSTPGYGRRQELDSDENIDHSYAAGSWNEVNVRNMNGHQKSYQGHQFIHRLILDLV